MSRIKVMSIMGQIIMSHEQAEIATDMEDPSVADFYVEVITPQGSYEYFGPVIVERFTQKEGKGGGE